MKQSPNIAPGNPILPIQLSLISWGIPKAERSEIVLCGHFTECLDKEMGPDGQRVGLWPLPQKPLFLAFLQPLYLPHFTEEGSNLQRDQGQAARVAN